MRRFRRLRCLIATWRWVRHYEKSLNERVKVEQELFDCASGKRVMPTREQCRQWAMRLGVPPEWRG